MKWGLVAASLSDMGRAVEDVSVPQCSGMLISIGPVPSCASFSNQLFPISIAMLHTENSSGIDWDSLE